ncbi:NAD kinase 2, mitochondrial [Rhodnius prolixus]|uniref:NAD(+) kinase n=2 Tax=Rhodnius TaxID=13248 RepID=T1HBD8_RHOPR
MLTNALFSRLSKLGTGHTVFARFVSTEKFNFQKVLLLKKRTRYELEKLQFPGISDKQLECIIRKRGSDFDTLFTTHKFQKAFTKGLIEKFKSVAGEVEVVDRTAYCRELVEWADLVVTSGGDGTFLLGASEVTSREKPIIGFNNDPDRSSGRLCLSEKYSRDPSIAIQKLLKNEFHWLYRTRIEVQLTGTRAAESCVELDQWPQPMSPGAVRPANCNDLNVDTQVVPYLALNEVFAGECLASQVSYLEMDVPGNVRTKVKCSGVCVSTGTGSTSWHMSINRLSLAKVHRILEIAKVEKSPAEVFDITTTFNDSLQFSPDDPRLFYNLRDLICGGVWPDPPSIPSDAFTPCLTVISKCYAANLVIDGTRAYPFNDGTIAYMYSKPENMLKTVALL